MTNLEARETEINEVLNTMGAEFTVHYISVNKPTSSYEGFALRKKGYSSAPIIPYTRSWDALSDQELAQHLSHLYEKNNDDIDVKSLLNSSFIYQNIYPMVVPTNKDPNLFSKPFLDLTLLYYVRIDENRTFRLSHSIIEHLQLDAEKLHERALENTLGTLKMVDLPVDIGDGKLLGVTNTDSHLGAGLMTNPELLGLIAYKLDTTEIYILPSSIHELVCLPVTEDLSPSYLSEMVHAVNESMVSEEEFLSNSVYKFSIKNGTKVVA